MSSRFVVIFFFNDTAPTEIYTLSLHDALPILRASSTGRAKAGNRGSIWSCSGASASTTCRDRKSTRLNSSHANISYAVFCLKKKKKNEDAGTLLIQCSRVLAQALRGQ